MNDPTKYASSIVRCSQVSPEAQAASTNCPIPGGDPIAYIVGLNLNLGSIKTDGIDIARRTVAKYREDDIIYLRRQAIEAFIAPLKAKAKIEYAPGEAPEAAAGCRGSILARLVPAPICPS